MRFIRAYIMYLIQEAARLYFSKLLIVGDFNFPNVNWHSWSTPSNVVGGLFLDTLDDEFLIQQVTFAASFRDSQTPTLDLIITTDDVQLHNLAADAPLGRSDHVMICFDYGHSYFI